MTINNALRLAIPSDGPLYEPTLLFLKSCGLGVVRNSARRYAAEIPALPGVIVHFQRHRDIFQKIEEGSADAGIVGYDGFSETRTVDGTSEVVIGELGFGHSQLVFAVPDSWVDVTSVSDLSDISREFRENGNDLRVATKFPRLVERFLLKNGVNYFSLVRATGTLEAAPAMGYADIIADLSSTGTTLRENHLKTLRGGVIITSEACLIANTREMDSSPEKLSQATSMVDRFEGHLRSLNYYSVTANVRSETAEEIATCILNDKDISGLTGPTISKVYTKEDDNWYAVTVMIQRDKLLDSVDRFRSIGSGSVTVTQPSYVFDSSCKAASRLTGNR